MLLQPAPKIPERSSIGIPANVEPIPLGPVLQEYFGRLGMTDPVVGARLLLMLITLDELETCQHGWR